MIRTVFFWASVFPEARRLLELHAPGAEAVWTGLDSGHYWRELSARWDDPARLAAGDCLLSVEQDIGLHAGVLPQLAACPGDWCEFRHPGAGGGLTWKGLGCDRFSARLRAAVPSAAVLARARADGLAAHFLTAAGELHWCSIDGPVYRAAEAAGFSCCEHRPPVRHFPAELARRAEDGSPPRPRAGGLPSVRA